MSKGLILVIDDEKDLLELVRYNLSQEGYGIHTAPNGEEGLAMARRHKPDMIILDIMLPRMDGLEVCKALRADATLRDVPIIMLTARADEADRVVGLEIGADDYITKPFSPREFSARVKALLRRRQPVVENPTPLRYSELFIDPASYKVRVKDELIPLTTTEFHLLRFLAERPDHVFTRDELIDGVLGRDVVVLDRTIDVHIAALRKKLGVAGSYIVTIRGVGYKFSE